jgi:membrane protein
MFGKKRKEHTGEKVSFSRKISAAVKMVRGDINLSDLTYGRFRKKIINAGRILFSAFEKFMKDDCLTKASSLAYATIISLIPMMAVAFTFMSFSTINREQLFSQIQKLLSEYNLSRLNIEPYLDAISNLLDNAKSIGGIGIIVLIFSATAVLRTLEHSLNTIWKTQRERSVVLKMIYYWAALTLFPIMLIAGTTAATQISTILSSPNNNVVYTTSEGSLWIAGNKGIIRHSEPKSNFFQMVTWDQIDSDNQRIYTFDNGFKTFVKDETFQSETDFNTMEFEAITFRGDKGWIVGKNGIVLVTENNGARWRIEKWGSFRFNDIVMINDKVGFIAASGGFLLKTTDSGNSWEALNWSEITSSINKIAFNGKNGYAVCNRGYMLKTTDSGANWIAVLVEQSRVKKKHVNLNSIHIFDDYRAWIGCDEGIVLTSNDGLSSFSQKKFKTYNFLSVRMISPNEGYAAGEDGVIIHSANGGNTWIKKDVHHGNVNMLSSRNGDIWAAGNAGLLVSTAVHKDIWNGEKGTGFIVSLLNFFGPFIFIWLSFLLVYLLLPNIKVPFKPAAIGASITGAIWVGFTLGFIVYVKSFANGTFAVYGALAAFPIFLLLVYASAVIILYGAEVSYMIVYVDSYLRRKRLKKTANEALVYTGLRILHDIYSRFEKGTGATSHEYIMKLSERTLEAEYYLTLFKNAKLIFENENGEYIPANSSENIKISDLLSLIHDASFEIPSNAPNDHLKKSFSELFIKIGESRTKLVGDMRLSEMIQG